MLRLLSALVAPILAALFLLQAADPAGAQEGPVYRLSTAEQIKEDVAAVPCEDKERLGAARALFERAGAPPDDVAVEKYKGVENLVLVRKGGSAEKVVVGAHYDKVAEGCGALDNWTGVVTLSHLYRTLKDTPLKKTLVFVAFGKEEKGLVGSRAMAGSLNKEQAAGYCAMVNVDSLGLAPPQVADNMSSRKLGQLAADLAKELGMPFRHARVEGADSDSSPFVGKRIPAVTIHGLDDDWPHILHNRKDQASRVDAANVYLGYRLALAMLVRLDESACAAYR